MRCNGRNITMMEAGTILTVLFQPLISLLSLLTKSVSKKCKGISSSRDPGVPGSRKQFEWLHHSCLQSHSTACQRALA